MKPEELFTRSHAVILTEQTCYTNSCSPVLKLFPTSQCGLGPPREMPCQFRKQTWGQAGKDSLQSAGLWDDDPSRLQSAPKCHLFLCKDRAHWLLWARLCSWWRGTLGRCLISHRAGNTVDRGGKIHVCWTGVHIFLVWLRDMSGSSKPLLGCRTIAVIYQAEGGTDFKELGVKD